MSELWPNLGVPDPVSAMLEAKSKPKPRAAPPQVPHDSLDINQQFERMLWAEMLAHAGLEKSLTMGGGEAASSFSRYVVEAIAADIAAKHPLGLTAAGSAYEQLSPAGKIS